MVVVELEHQQQVYLDLKNDQSREIPSTGMRPTHMLILVTPDVDSLCAARILGGMLRSDLLTYKITPVQSYEDLVAAAKEYLQDENALSIVMINCGGNYDLTTALGTLESRVTIYILDSHRPYHLANVDSEQIKLLDSVPLTGIYPKWEGGDSEDEADEDGGRDMFDDEEDDLEEVGGRRSDLEDSEDSGEDLEIGSDESEDEREERQQREDGSEGYNSDGSSPKRRKRSDDKKAQRQKLREEAQRRKAAKTARRAAKARRREEKEMRRTERIAAKQDKRRERVGLSRTRRLMEKEQYLHDVADYYKTSSYNIPTAVMLYELAGKLGKAGNHDLWLAMLGLTDQVVQERIEQSSYVTMQTHLSSLIPLFNTSIEQQAEQLRAKARDLGLQAQDALVIPVGHVADVQEWRFPLMRHWTLYDSLEHSIYSASRMMTWLESGKDKLQTLLTDIGVKTADAQQPYRLMKSSDKQRVEILLEDKGMDDRHNLPDLRFNSFHRQLTPTLSVTAADEVLALSAILECPQQDAKSKGASSAAASSSNWTWKEGFSRAWAAVEQGNAEAAGVIERGLQSAIQVQQVLYDTATSIVSGKSIRSQGSFRSVTLTESIHSPLLSRPLALARLGHFIFEIGATMRESPMKKPLVLCSPIPGKGEYLVVAVMGTMHTEGVAFQKSERQRQGDRRVRGIAWLRWEAGLIVLCFSLPPSVPSARSSLPPPVRPCPNARRRKLSTR